MNILSRLHHARIYLASVSFMVPLTLLTGKCLRLFELLRGNQLADPIKWECVGNVKNAVFQFAFLPVTLPPPPLSIVGYPKKKSLITNMRELMVGPERVKELHTRG